MKLSNKIYELRKKNDYTQDDLAELISVSRQTISNWETGETQPNPDQLLLLAKSFKVSVSELLGEEPIRVTKQVNISNIGLYILIGLLIIALVIVLILFFNEKDKNVIRLTKTTSNLISTSRGYTKSTKYKEDDTFIRTYKVETIDKEICNDDMTGCDDTTYRVTLSICGKDSQTLLISNNQDFKNLKKGKTYEFKFAPMVGEVAFENPNDIRSSFAAGRVVSVTETNKKCSEQRQDKLKTRSE